MKMKMYEQHPSFDEPSADVTIWRYLDLAKFAAMLFKSSLYFSRIDLLGDPMEGSIQIELLRAEEEKAKELEEYEKLRIIQHNIQGMVYLNDDIMKPNTYVNCWSMGKSESIGMWHEYVTDCGVAIKSSYGRLKKVFNEHRYHLIRIGSIKYLDYSKHWIPGDNAFNPFLHKRIFFSEEQELRAMISDIGGEHDQTYSDEVWRRVESGRLPELEPYLNQIKTGSVGFGPEEKEELKRYNIMFENAKRKVMYEINPAGINVEVDLKQLFEAVYISPSAQSWFVDVVSELIERTIGSSVTILRSGVDMPI